MASISTRYTGQDPTTFHSWSGPNIGVQVKTRNGSPTLNIVTWIPVILRVFY